MRTRMEENDVLSEMSRQPLAGRMAVTEIAPFWLSTVIRPPTVSSVTPANEVFTLTSPLTFRAVTEPLLFPTVRLQLMPSASTLPKLVFANASPPMSVSVIPPLPVTARIPFGILEASIAPKEDLSVTPPRASRTSTLPLEVSASSAPLMVSSSMLPKESRIVTEAPRADLPLTRALLVTQFTRPRTSEKVTLPKLLVMSAEPPILENSTLPLLSRTRRSRSEEHTSELQSQSNL